MEDKLKLQPLSATLEVFARPVLDATLQKLRCEQLPRSGSTASFTTACLGPCSVLANSDTNVVSVTLPANLLPIGVPSFAGLAMNVKDVSLFQQA
ncbi:hypothetical protein PISMIDRAFT_14982 [Pisolithus microcarpus 441]|uniref:Uncharacterized protein n=1 Tax=Pisolithus microcarpus 441 TaxID=765257 RepID=A0A0C9ZCG9_9AGAM|nr:hypothetical protein PISMIDRAFT_14982 [Pisolithus microcarpus 441]